MSLYLNAIDTVSINGLAIADLSKENINEDVIIAAVKQNPAALKYVTITKAIAMAALSASPNAFLFLPSHLQEDEDLLLLSKQRKLERVLFDPSPTRKIFISSRQEEFLTRFGIEEEIVPLRRSEDVSSFIRDASVRLPNGMLLIPYPMVQKEFHLQLLASLPPTLDHFIQDSELPLMGKGYTHNEVNAAIKAAYENQISFKQATTCIEGGNCLWAGKTALVGEVSLYLSYFALENQNAFEGLEVISTTPSLVAIRMARNLDLISKKPYISVKTLDELLVNFTKEPTPTDIETYTSDACLIESKLQMTKNRIQSELGAERVIFLPHYDFHIDLEEFVTPDGHVGLNDTEMITHLIQGAKENATAKQLLTYKRCEQILACTQDEVKHKLRIQQLVKEILKEQNIHTRPLPLAFDFINTNLNLCNGIFVTRKNKPTFLTTGHTNKQEKVLHKLFVKALKEAFPQYKVKSIEGLSRFLTEFGGGLHCMTFEG